MIDSTDGPDRRNELNGFAEFFERATGVGPYTYQTRIAEDDSLPELIEVPTGLGKTAAIVLGWLWRRCRAEERIQTATPRRLIVCLPQRSLTDQVSSQIRRWLDNLDASDVSLHVVMGGRGRAARPWRESPETTSIIVGTIDMLTSKALVRGYGTPRNAFPMDAALMWNDSHIVVDEVQAAPETTVTFRQIDSFRRGRTIGPTGLTCMSATVPKGLVRTVDNPFPDERRIVRIDQDGSDPKLIRRRTATRTVRELPIPAGNARQLAAEAIQRHVTGSLTLVIVNTVKMACEVFAAVDKLRSQVPSMLLHSRFRPTDRAPMIAELTEPLPAHGRLVVATQVIEAGIDIDARTLITEVAPWPSLIQRSGRCNRAGTYADAQFWWTRSARPVPYEPRDIASATQALEKLENRTVTNEHLLDLAVETTMPPTLTLRRRDFLSLFDTTPDLSGNDLDIAPYVRDTDDLTVALCWMDWVGTAPPDDLRPLDSDQRCRVPLTQVLDLRKRGVRVWRFEHTQGRWRTVEDQSPARPGEVLLVAAADGGYRVDIGFDAASRTPVPAGPSDGDDQAEHLAEVEAAEQSFDGDPLATGLAHWIPLDQHLSETADEARRLVASLALTADEAADVIIAAQLHDVGKAHPTWQDALCASAQDSERDNVTAGRPWAKSAADKRRLTYPPGITGFRHELAGLLLLDGPLASLLAGAHDRNLVRYLVLAHHGRLRTQVRDPHGTDSERLLGLTSGDVMSIAPVLGGSPSQLLTSLEQFELGAGDSGTPSWTDTAAGLVERYGVFRLALLETLVRVADWRASALHATGGGPA